MQGGLISHRAAQERVAVLVQRDGQAVEPLRPTGLQVSLEADFVILTTRGRYVNHFVPHVFLSWLICPYNTAGGGELSSPHAVIEVVIEGGKQKCPSRWLVTPAGAGRGNTGQLEQIEFLGAADGRPAVVDPQFVEYVFGVGAHGVERHVQSLGNFWAA